MKIGDKVEVRVRDGGQGPWHHAKGAIELISPNHRSGVLFFDEGIPAPFGLIGDKQAIFISQPGGPPGQATSTLYVDLHNSQREVEVGIICPRCGKTSWNLHDMLERYCGGCHAFYEDPNATH